MPATPANAAAVRMGSVAGRWVILTTVLGSGIAFLDGTVVNVALPAIAGDLDADLAGLQWVLDSYLVTLTVFLLLGGSLGDLYGRRRIYRMGLVVFTAASVACAAAPTVGVLVGRGRHKGSEALCSCRGASRSSPRRSIPTTAAGRSACGRG